jgi:hypothetical protein
VGLNGLPPITNELNYSTFLHEMGHVVDVDAHRLQHPYTVRYQKDDGPPRRAPHPVNILSVTANPPCVAVSSIRRCPACGHGQLIVIDSLPPTRRPAFIPDTS